MKSALKWPLQMAVMDKLSWRLQSTFLIGLIGLSSKIFLGECWQSCPVAFKEDLGVSLVSNSLNFIHRIKINKS